MTSIFSLAQRYVHILLFIVLEFISLYLVVNYNSSQRIIITNSGNQLTGFIKSYTTRISGLVSLEKENERLSTENAALIREVIELTDQLQMEKSSAERSFDYDVTPAKVLSQSLHSQRNTILLNKGLADSISTDLGVVSYDGLVGKVTQVSENYCKVMSLLNIDTKISATLAGNQHFGTVSWTGGSINELILEGIPNHAAVNRGDTVVTNGFSTIFPPGILVGIVQSWDLEKSGEFYKIKLSPMSTFNTLNNVFIVNNLSSTEIHSLYEE